MRKKIIIINFFTVIFFLLLVQICFAKYVISDSKSLEVFIDKTPPVIDLVSDNINEKYTTTDLENVIQSPSNITINTSDNVKIKINEYWYNPTERDFNNKTPTKFKSGKQFNDNGFYKISTSDTSGNKTEIIILIDKTPPNIELKYYKKGEKVAKTEVTKISVKAVHLMASNIEKVDDKYSNLSEITSTSKISARSSAYVRNESELRNAINNRISDITTGDSIPIYNSINIDYNVTIHPGTNENALQFKGTGTFLNIQNGGSLNLHSMVIDSSNSGVTEINVLNGGRVAFTSGSIIDIKAGNTGIVVNDGGRVELYSSSFLGGSKGIVVKNNGILAFGDEGGKNEFFNNTVAIYFENFSGNCNFDRNNIKIRNNTIGISNTTSSGTINFLNGNIYNNTTGIDFGNGKLNISGGNIYSNGTGIYLNRNYNGKMTITGGNIYANTQYAINHSQNIDGNCTIHAGSISGKIFLALDDNYINTNDKYPTFEVTPSKYFFGRKLVKTTNNTCANTEIAKVTLTKNSNWYKYVNNNEYIVVWRDCNVKINYNDFFGKIIKTETITGKFGESYETTPKELEGYDLIEIPDNQKGTFTEDDIIVSYKYDLKNIAVVKYEDLLSGVQSAKVWYNATSENFTGEGTDFENNKTFEDYGYYKIEVINGVGLRKEIKFVLNKESIVR